jgi:hypothetical protein
MSYTDSLLASGEQIVRRARQHWFVMVWNARWAVVAILAAIALIIMRALIGGSGPLLDLLGWATAILFLVGLAVIAWGWLRYQNEEFVITSRRIIHVSGVINKQASDSSLEMINDAVLRESVFGRMFGFGDLEVLTASESGIDDLMMLTDAKAFKKAMIEAKHELALELERPTMPPIRAGSGADTGGTSAPAPAAPAMVAPAPQPPAVEPGRVAPTLTGDEAPRAASAAPPGAQPMPAPTTPPATGHEGETMRDATDALDRLADLHDRGVVTDEEFERKKRELLDRL